MKKLICILLAICCCCSLALAEEANPFAPYTLTVPEGAELEESEGTYTIVSGMTRVVVIPIPRVPDENPAEAVIRLMNQFAPLAVIGEDLPTQAGFTGLMAVGDDAFGEGVDQLTAMLLSDAGDLLILSGHDLTGDEEKVNALMDALLASLTVDGEKIILTEE